MWMKKDSGRVYHFCIVALRCIHQWVGSALLASCRLTKDSKASTGEHFVLGYGGGGTRIRSGSWFGYLLVEDRRRIRTPTPSDSGLSYSECCILSSGSPRTRFSVGEVATFLLSRASRVILSPAFLAPAGGGLG